MSSFVIQRVKFFNNLIIKRGNIFKTFYNCSLHNAFPNKRLKNELFKTPCNKKPFELPKSSSQNLANVLFFLNKFVKRMTHPYVREIIKP
jgi:hypothetical protein